MRGRENDFEDSDIDWDALPARPGPAADLRAATGMNLLAWVVLVILIFCPLLGFVLATAG
jgi:hypothetical protein